MCAQDVPCLGCAGARHWQSAACAVGQGLGESCCFLPSWKFKWGTTDPEQLQAWRLFFSTSDFPLGSHTRWTSQAFLSSSFPQALLILWPLIAFLPQLFARLLLCLFQSHTPVLASHSFFQPPLYFQPSTLVGALCSELCAEGQGGGHSLLPH